MGARGREFESRHPDKDCKSSLTTSGLVCNNDIVPRGVTNLPLKEKAILLRMNGYSYELIKQELKLEIPHATLSNWLTKIPYKPNSEVLERMKRGSIKSSETSKRLRLERIKEVRRIAKQELGKISKRDLMLLGIGLYIGEGAKYDRGLIQFSNSDPKVIQLAMKWFTKILRVDSSHFKVVLHTYPDSEARVALKYWSKITGIPEGQFGKIYVDVRKNKSVKNKRKLPYGTIHIRIRALGKKEFGVNLYQKVLGWIALVEENNFAGIV